MFFRDLPGKLATADEFRLDTRGPLKTQIIILLSLQTLLFCVFPYFPSQDGPAHLGSAAVLSALSAGDDLYHQIYASAWLFDSNQQYHALLVLLEKFMPLLAAEKVILSLYGVAFTASLWCLTSSVHGRHEAVLLGLPVVFSGVLYMGFFNSCLAFVAGIWSLGLFFKLYDHCIWQRMASLASALLLTYFLHIFVLRVLLPAMLLLSIARYFTCLHHHKIQETAPCTPHQNYQWAATFGWILAAFPSIALVILFMATTNESAGADSASLLQQFSTVASFNGFRLLVKAYNFLITFSLLDLAIQLPWLALLTWVTVCCLRTRKSSVGIGNSMTTFNHSYLQVAFVALITWLSTGALSSRQWHRVAQLATLVVGAQLIYRFPAHTNLIADIAGIAEYVQVQAKIPAQSSMLSIDMGPESHGYLRLVSWVIPIFRFVSNPVYRLRKQRRFGKTRHSSSTCRHQNFSPSLPCKLSPCSPTWRSQKKGRHLKLLSELNRLGFTESFVFSQRGLARVFSK